MNDDSHLKWYINNDSLMTHYKILGNVECFYLYFKHTVCRSVCYVFFRGVLRVATFWPFFNFFTQKLSPTAFLLVASLKLTLYPPNLLPFRANSSTTIIKCCSTRARSCLAWKDPLPRALSRSFGQRKYQGSSFE